MFLNFLDKIVNPPTHTTLPCNPTFSMDLILAEDLLFEDDVGDEWFSCDRISWPLFNQVLENPVFLSTIDRSQFHKRVTQGAVKFPEPEHILAEVLDAKIQSFRSKIVFQNWVRVVVVMNEDDELHEGHRTTQVFQTILPLDVLHFFVAKDSTLTITDPTPTTKPATHILVKHHLLMVSKLLTLFVYLILPEENIKRGDYTSLPFSPPDVRYMHNNLADIQQTQAGVDCQHHLIVVIES